MSQVTKESLPAGAVTSSESLVKRYLRIGKKQGDHFSVDDVSTMPTLELAQKRILSFGIPAARALSGLLEPGMTIDLYGRSGAPPESKPFTLPDLTVEAVIDPCADGVSADIVVIVSLPAAESMPSLDMLLGAAELFLVARGG